MDNFAVFILTHGRPDNVITHDTLRRQGYTGRIYLIIDNEDSTAEKYYQNYGRDNVIMFDKLEVSKTFDQFDNFGDRRAIVYARNACFNIAEKLGIEYFVQLDDDYTNFIYRINNYFEIPEGKWIIRKKLDQVFKYYLEYYKSTNAHSIALSQGGDYIGGHVGKYWKSKRKAMNSFFCSTKKKFSFIGRINEDVNTYTCQASRGYTFFTVPFVMLTQKMTQTNAGGMSDIYLDNGTYIKSFYTVICSPSCVSIKLMGSTNKRLHHSVKWQYATPMIINERHKRTIK